MTSHETPTMNVFFGLLKFRLIRFLLVGGANTLFSYSVYAIFLFLGASYVLSNFLALIFGIFFSFRTQGMFVFENTEKRLFCRFIIAWGIIYIFNIFFIRELVESGISAYASGALAIVPITVISYFIQRFFVFRNIVPP